MLTCSGGGGSGSPGNVSSGWDLVAIEGSLTLNGLGAGNEMNILLTSLTPGSVPGLAANFNSANDYAWRFADADSPIASYGGPNQFDVDLSSFANPVSDNSSVLLGSNPVVLALTGNASVATQLYLVYQSSEAAVVPEPTTWAMAAIGLLGFLLLARRSCLARLASMG